jgi:hypothetical protein
LHRGLQITIHIRNVLEEGYDNAEQTHEHAGIEKRLRQNSVPKETRGNLAARCQPARHWAHRWSTQAMCRKKPN